jgi:hypothetical protein
MVDRGQRFNSATVVNSGRSWSRVCDLAADCGGWQWSTVVEPVMAIVVSTMNDHYRPLSTTIDHCWPLLTTVDHCWPLLTLLTTTVGRKIAHPWPQPTTVDCLHYWPLLATINPERPLSTTINHLTSALSFSTTINHCWPLLTLLTTADNFQPILVATVSNTIHHCQPP